MPSPALTHLELMTNRPDPLLSFKWVVHGGFTNGRVGSILPAEYVESVEIPFNNVKSENIFAGSGYNYFASFHDVSSFTVNFYMDVDNTVMAWLAEWKNKVKNFSTGVYGLPKDYKGEVTIHLLDNQNDGVMAAKLQGIWPADTNNFQLDSENNRLVISQNFSIDGQEVYSLKGKQFKM